MRVETEQGDKQLQSQQNCKHATNESETCVRALSLRELGRRKESATAANILPGRPIADVCVACKHGDRPLRPSGAPWRPTTIVSAAYR